MHCIYRSVEEFGAEKCGDEGEQVVVNTLIHPLEVRQCQDQDLQGVTLRPVVEHPENALSKITVSL